MRICQHIQLLSQEIEEVALIWCLILTIFFYFDSGAWFEFLLQSQLLRNSLYGGKRKITFQIVNLKRKGSSIYTWDFQTYYGNRNSITVLIGNDWWLDKPVVDMIWSSCHCRLVDSPLREARDGPDHVDVVIFTVLYVWVLYILGASGGIESQQEKNNGTIIPSWS